MRENQGFASAHVPFRLDWQVKMSDDSEQAVACGENERDWCAVIGCGGGEQEGAWGTGWLMGSCT